MLMDIGENIRSMRRHMKITQVELSEMTGIKQPTISAIETGTNKPAIDTLLLISGAIGCTVSELIGEKQPNNSVLTENQRALIEIYDQLNDTGKAFLIQQADFAVSQSAFRQDRPQRSAI